ncbi:hypothetical protein [Alienimonas californiensis]|uniref:Uncharacterized protein n=1 Tax=Alienimonas californiensis TaxID=2527989 RepID=A0A517P4X8_9PLAN|nr:hypothetical protein [Alienimonas californiensis]QDT14430.1 hypothetical protein CA12_05030 [Alienimonas californiensis]
MFRSLVHLPPALRSAAAGLVVGLGLTAAAGCGGVGFAGPPAAADPPAAAEAPGAVVTFFGGPNAYAAVANPKRVEAYRVSHRSRTPAPPTGEAPPAGEAPPPEPAWVGDYRETAGPVAVPGGKAAALSAALRSGDWLSPHTGKRCLPTYGVKLRFTGCDGTVADVWVCFECDLVAVVAGGKQTGRDDSEALRPALLAVAKAAFPQDAAIAGLE